MVKRRNLFGYLAVAPIACTSASIAMARSSDAPTNALMRLTQGNPNARMYLTAGEQNEKAQEVGLAIGKDGNLWLNSNNEWKRIVVE